GRTRVRNSRGAFAPITSVICAPQSPPCATKRVYPRRLIRRSTERQRVLVRRLDVDNVDVEAVDLRDELRQRVQFASNLRKSVLGARSDDGPLRIATIGQHANQSPVVSREGGARR